MEQNQLHQLHFWHCFAYRTFGLNRRRDDDHQNNSYKLHQKPVKDSAAPPKRTSHFTFLLLFVIQRHAMEQVIRMVNDSSEISKYSLNIQVAAGLYNSWFYSRFRVPRDDE